MAAFSLGICLSLWSSVEGAEASPTLKKVADITEHTPNVGEIRIVPVDPTPEGDEILTLIVYPKNGEVKNSPSFTIQTRLEGYPLGILSDFPRHKEIYDDPEGQSLYVILDDNPPLTINESFVDSLDNNENYYEELLEVAIPYMLDPGMHVIRAFPVRSYGESLKGDGCFAASIFYYQSQEETLAFSLDDAYLTYNQPYGEYAFGKPILLDFYLTNVQLSRDGYKVRVSIDGAAQRTLTQWIPYYMHGLKRGTHTIRLQLLDPQNKQVPGPFNDVQRTISIY